MELFHQYLKAERGRAIRLATVLGINAAAISQWDRVPAERVLAVEDATGIPRHKLRPDLYPLEKAS